MTDSPGVPTWDSPGGPPPFAAGHTVEYLRTGEIWTIDEYYPATPAREARLMLGRSSVIDGAARGTVMDATPDQVRLITIAGRPDWPPYAAGDLVEDLLTDETWTVQDYVPAGAGRTAQVKLVRAASGGPDHGETADPRHLRLLVSWTERAMFPGDGWSQPLLAAAPHEPPADGLSGLDFPAPDPARVRRGAAGTASGSANTPARRARPGPGSGPGRSRA